MMIKDGRQQKGILETLLEAGGNYISGQDLAKRLGVSRTSIWKGIQRLRGEGYRILARPRSGYRLIRRKDGLLPAEIRYGLATRIMAKEVLYFKEIPSTNGLAKDLAAQGYEEGTLIIAERQSQGKGRLGRSWFSPEGGIYSSLILRPRINPGLVPLLTLLAGVAVAKAIRKRLGLFAAIKWPNDVLINNKKVSGLLSEMEAELDMVSFVIIGIGINANIEARQFPQGLSYPATSLMEEKKEKIDRRGLLQEVLVEMEDLYLPFKEQDYTSTLEAYQDLDATFAKRVKVRLIDGVLEGEARGIDRDGSLRLWLSNGETRKIYSGEVIL